MTARLAGSRLLDERRRRRLAADSGENPLFTLAAKPQRGGQAAVSSHIPDALHFPLRKAISRRMWKIWGVGTLGLIFAAAILAAGFYAERAADIVGPAFVHLFDLAEGRAIRFFGIVYFALCGQLAVFVWWGRSRRARRLSGGHRVWSSLAATCFLISFLVATDAHLALNDTVHWLLKRDLGPRIDVCWLGPLAGCMLIFLWMLHRDVRECRTGLVMLWLAALSWTAAGSMVVVENIPAEPLTITLTQNAAAMFGHWCFLMSLVLHARHVVYKSSEAPKAAAAKTGWRFPRIRLWKSATSSDTAAADGNSKRRAAKESAAAAIDKKAKPRPTAKPEPAAKSAPPVAAKPATPVAVKTAAPVASKPAATVSQPLKAAPAVATSKVDQPRPKPSTQTLRIDDPDDDSDSESDDDGMDKSSLKGLSKRERRKLRKQWRDEQRGASGDSDSDSDE